MAKEEETEIITPTPPSPNPNPSNHNPHPHQVFVFHIDLSNQNPFSFPFPRFFISSHFQELEEEKRNSSNSFQLHGTSAAPLPPPIPPRVRSNLSKAIWNPNFRFLLGSGVLFFFYFCFEMYVAGIFSGRRCNVPVRCMVGVRA